MDIANQRQTEQARPSHQGDHPDVPLTRKANQHDAEHEANRKGYHYKLAGYPFLQIIRLFHIVVISYLKMVRVARTYALLFQTSLLNKPLAVSAELRDR